VGFDISWGVRLLVAGLTRSEAAVRLERLMDLLAAAIPTGMGRGGVLPAADSASLDGILAGGSTRWSAASAYRPTSPSARMPARWLGPTPPP
jgi:RNA-splicing ligase RtcB